MVNDVLMISLEDFSIEAAFFIWSPKDPKRRSPTGHRLCVW